MAGSQRILHVAGYDSCEFRRKVEARTRAWNSSHFFITSFITGGFFTRALTVLRSVAVLFPTRIKVIPHTFEDRTSYRAWLIDDGFRSCFQDARAHSHSTSPICWFTNSDNDGFVKEDIQAFLGGHDDTLYVSSYNDPVNLPALQLVLFLTQCFSCAPSAATGVASFFRHLKLTMPLRKR
jgi:hypothetical protein